MKESWCAHRGIDQGGRLQVCLRDENVAKRGRSRKRIARQRSSVEHLSNCAESNIETSVVTGCRAVIMWSVDGACRKVHLFYGPGQSRETCWVALSRGHSASKAGAVRRLVHVTFWQLPVYHSDNARSSQILFPS
jgi:hypothetical protein